METKNKLETVSLPEVSSQSTEEIILQNLSNLSSILYTNSFMKGFLLNILGLQSMAKFH